LRNSLRAKGKNKNRGFLSETGSDNELDVTVWLTLNIGASGVEILLHT